MHCEQDEKIYMRQHYGFVSSEYPDHVFILQKSLYALKQSPRQWYKCFDAFVLRIRYPRDSYDASIYFSSFDNNHVYILLYFD